MEDDRTAAIARDYFERIVAPETEAFVVLFAPDLHFEDPVGTPPVTSIDDLAAFHKGLHRAWSALTMQVDAVHVRGDRAAVKWSASGTSATGKDIDFEGIDVLEVDDHGRIARLEGFWDLEGVIGQM
ncbi:MAG: nuclear transport factor 2 family protein [Anaerolineae bacterium]